MPDTNKDNIDMCVAFKSIISKQVWKHFMGKGEALPWSHLLTIDNHYVFFIKIQWKKEVYKNDLHSKKYQEERETKFTWNSRRVANTLKCPFFCILMAKKGISPKWNILLKLERNNHTKDDPIVLCLHINFKKDLVAYLPEVK